MKLGIRAKLLAPFAVLMLFTLVVGGTGLAQAGQINAHAAEMYSDDLVGMDLMTHLTKDMLLLRGKTLTHILTPDAAGKTALEAEMAELDQAIAATVQTVQEGDTDGRQVKELAHFAQVWPGYVKARDTLTLVASRAGKPEQGLAYYDGEEAAQFEAVFDAMDALIESKVTSAQLTAEQNTTNYTQAGQWIVGATILALLIGTALVWLLVRIIGGAVTQVAAAAQGLAEGKLDQQITVRSRDELGEMAEALRGMIGYQNRMAGVAEAIAAGDLGVAVTPQSAQDVFGTAFQRMTANLRGLLQEIGDAVDVLASSSAEIAAATNQMAAGAAQTATAVAETTATVEEVKQTALLSQDKATNVADSAQRSAQVSQVGARAVDDAIDGMAHIRAQMEAVADSVVLLSEQRQAISEIITSVNDLAEQSNLLSVNAAIEAAKAGEQGRGFAVVAQEVKRLAEQSKQATVQVRGILNDIEKATTAAVMATEQSSKAVQAGVQQSTNAGAAIRSLADSIEEATHAALQITVSSQQQRIGMDQIALAMENIKQASTQNVVGTKQTAVSAQDLRDLGQKLRLIVGRYRV